MVKYGGAFVTSLFVLWTTLASLNPWFAMAGQAVATPATAAERTLRLAGPIAGLTTLDPALSPDQATTEILRLTYSGLMRFDADLEPVLDLAERIDVSPDATRYVAHLRPDARFHDGRPILAGDVASSLARSLTPTVNHPVALLSGPLTLTDIAGADALLAGTVTTLAGVSTPDARTVVITLARPRTDFLPRLASVAALVNDGPATADGILNGSGHFRIADWDPERELRLERVTAAIAEDQVTGITLALGPAAAQPFNLYQQGLIDLVTVPSGSAARVLTDRVLSPRVIRRESFATHHIGFRTDQEPLDDVHVRRAIQLAFPRGAVADVTFGGLVDPADGMVPRSLLPPDLAAALPAPDLAAARAALARSRYGSAEAVPAFEIAAHADQTVEALRDVLVRDLGLRVTVVTYPWPEFLAGLADGAFAAYGLLWVADYPSPDALLWPLFSTDGPANASGYRNSTFDAALDAARSAADPRARAAHYARAQAALVADAVVIPTYHPVDYVLVAERVSDVAVTPVGLVEIDQLRVTLPPTVVG